MYRTKYKNQKVMLDGIKFDSKKERNRYSELKMLEQIGAISNLKLQEEFVLIPTQRENGKKGKVIERAVKYKADFTYIDTETDKLVVEDTKGVKTPEYIIKRKLMLWVHGIRITEV